MIKVIQSSLLMILLLLTQSCKGYLEFEMKRYFFFFFLSLIIGIVGLLISAVKKNRIMRSMIFGCSLLLMMVTIYCTPPSSKKESVLDDIKIINDTTGTESERNLREQLIEYLTAFNSGDGERAIKYVYPGTLQFLKSQYPADYDEQDIKDNFKTMIDSLKETVKKTESKYEFELGQIRKRIDYKGDLIYVIEIFVHVTKDLNKYTFGEETIGFSSDNGLTWTFLANDKEDAKTILQYKYPEKVILAIKKAEN